MKNTGLIKVITCSALVMALLTWLITASYYSGGELQNLGYNRMGIFDILNYPVLTFQYFAQTLLFLVTVGGFYGVLSKTGRYRSFVTKFANKFKGHEAVLIVLVSFTLAILNAVFGFGLLLFIFVPFLCAVIIMLGYDKITAFLVTFVPQIIGVIGSIYSNSITGQLKAVTELEYADVYKMEIIVFALAYIVYLWFVFHHANKIKRNEKATLIESDPFIGEAKSNNKSTVALTIIFVLLAITLVLACTPWNDVFGITYFADKLTKIQTADSGLAKVINGLLGQVGPFGEWSNIEMIVCLVLASLLAGNCYKLKFRDIYEGFAKGVVELLEPAVVITLAMVLLVITAYHPIYITMLDGVMKHFSTLNAVAVLPTGIMTMIGSFLNIDMLYFAQSGAPYLVDAFKNIDATNIARTLQILMQSFYGLTMLIAPTSTVLILGLEYLNIPYKEWLKKCWVLIASLAVVITLCTLLSFKL